MLLKFLQTFSHHKWMLQMAELSNGYVDKLVSRHFIVHFKNYLLEETTLEELCDYAWEMERQLMTFLMMIIIFGGLFVLFALPLTFKALFFAKRRFQPKRYWKKSVTVVAFPAFLFLLVAL